METKQKKKTTAICKTISSSQRVSPSIIQKREKTNLKKIKAGKIKQKDHYLYFNHPLGMRWIWMMG